MKRLSDISTIKEILSKHGFTFSKSLASLGGFMAANKTVVNFVMHNSRPYIFSASMPPANCAAALTALRIIKREPERVKRLSDLSAYARQGFRKRGIKIIESDTPIIPVYTYELENTFQKPFVVMELDPEPEKGLVYVIKVFKSQFGEDFSPTIISAHDSFDRHDKWSAHRVGRAVDISFADLPLKQRRRVVKILKATLPDDYTIVWENLGIQNELLHFQYHQ